MSGGWIVAVPVGERGERGEATDGLAGNGSSPISEAIDLGV